MSKSRFFSSLMIGLLFALSGYAQDFTFKVLGTKGENSVDGKSLKIGDKITANQSITLGGSAVYLGLAYKNGKTIELKNAGVYKVADLEKQVASSSSSSLADKYASLILDEMTGSENGGNRHGQRVKTGSVTRALNNQIQMMMPLSSEFADAKAMIKWNFSDKFVMDPSEITGYKFVVRNAFRQIVHEQETGNNFVSLDLADEKFKNEKALTCSVVALGKEGVTSDEIALKKLKHKDAEEVKSALASLPTEETALNKIIMARYFEDKGLVANAIYAYETATRLSDLEQYKQMYQDFLKRQELVANASAKAE